MKAYKSIIKDIKKNFETIEAMKADIARLDYKAEKAAAVDDIRIGTPANPENVAAYKDFCEKARQNAPEIEKIKSKIFIAEVKTRILKANARAALLNEALPVIIEACKPYEGKPYGEKTAEKIREEVKKAGYGFYFDGYHNNRINIYTLTSEGYKSHADETCGQANDESGHIADFLTADNRLQICSIYKIVPFRDKYEENPAKAAATVAKALKNYMKATKDLEKQRGELIHMMPDGIPEPEYVKDYYIYF